MAAEAGVDAVALPQGDWKSFRTKGDVLILRLSFVNLYHIAFFLPRAAYCSIKFYGSIGVNLNGAAGRRVMELRVVGCNVPNQFPSTSLCTEGGKNSSKLKYGSRKQGFQANFLRMHGCYSDHICREKDKRNIYWGLQNQPMWSAALQEAGWLCV